MHRTAVTVSWTRGKLKGDKEAQSPLTAFEVLRAGKGKQLVLDQYRVRDQIKECEFPPDASDPVSGTPGSMTPSCRS
jgi:hypothetical protein